MPRYRPGVAVDVVLVIHPAAYEKAFKSRSGMVGDYIAEVAKDVETAARFEAPGPGKIPRNRTHINYGTGRLAGSIRSDVDALAGEVQAVVYTREPHAKYVIGGTAPHVIRPRTPGGVLRFFWWRKMAWVAFRHVNHPGTEANNFLERALKKGLAVHGIT